MVLPTAFRGVDKGQPLGQQPGLPAISSLAILLFRLSEGAITFEQLTDDSFQFKDWTYNTKAEAAANSAWDVAPDGRFLMLKRSQNAESEKLKFTSWPANVCQSLRWRTSSSVMRA